MLTSKLLLGALVINGAMLFAPIAAWADAAQAKATAVRHAEFAVDADNIAGVRTHLHHALNCLVGPEGRGFDQSAGNPCQASGAVIPQTVDPELKMKLEELADKVRDGVQSDDIGSAKDAAKRVQEELAHDD